MRLHANKYVEALLYVAIPLAVHVALTPRLLRRAVRQTKGLVLGHPDKGYVVREISATTTFHGWRATVNKADELNLMLQRALAEFVADKMKLDEDRTDTVYQLLDRPLQDQHAARKSKEAAGNAVDSDDNDGTTDDDDTDDDDDDYEKQEYTYEQLLQLRVAATPAPETWAQVAPGVFFQYVVTGVGDSAEDEDNAQDGHYDRRVTMTFRLRSKRPDASETIDALVAQAFFEYKKRQILKSAQDTTRYMFVQTVAEQPKRPAGGDSQDDTPKNRHTLAKKLVFKRYPLGDDKTFRNLFFQDKTRVLHLLDSFTNRRGKFAVKGFPYKLGLLLHGPPGTGKTSLIKAVAQYTKRHIVSISLSKIRTNQELMDAVFDLRFPIEGRATPVVLDFKDVVFVMEDIDCAGASVVHARNAEEDSETRPRRRMTVPTQTSDKLNLSGLLNVLDGVIDCPGRIVIMTTNHPEKLDPALIRPGRVNAQLLLGAMAAPQVIEMLEYYFSTELSLPEREDLEEAMATGAALTPAQVEEICAEQDTITDAIDAVRRAVAQ